MAGKFFDFLSQSINDRKRTELLGEIEVVSEQLFLQSLKYTEATPPQAMPKWMDKAQELLTDARNKASTDIDMGWRILKIARRMLVEGYDVTQCIARIKGLLGNMGRLDTTTQNAIKALFPSDNQGVLDVATLQTWDIDTLRFSLSNALQINDWYFDNEYLKTNKSRINLRRALLLFWIGSALFPFIYLGLTDLLGMPRFMGDWKNFFFVGIYGWIGAAFSIVTRITSADEQGNKSLPQSMQDGENLMFRSLIGPGAAMLMYMFIQSGIINPSIFYLEQNTQNIETPTLSTPANDPLNDSTKVLPMPIPATTDDEIKKDTASDVASGLSTNVPSVAPNQKINNPATAHVEASKGSGGGNDDGSSPKMSFMIMVLAFLAGFSERLVIQILEKLGDKVETLS